MVCLEHAKGRAIKDEVCNIQELEKCLLITIKLLAHGGEAATSERKHHFDNSFTHWHEAIQQKIPCGFYIHNGDCRKKSRGINPSTTVSPRFTSHQWVVDDGILSSFFSLFKKYWTKNKK